MAEENPLRSATSRIVTAADLVRLRVASGFDGSGDAALRDFPEPLFRVGFESEDSMDSLNLALLLADTTGR